MNGRSRRYLELGGRADDFSAVHLDTDAGYNIAAGRLTHLVEQGRGLAAMQREGTDRCPRSFQAEEGAAAGNPASHRALQRIEHLEN